jgi:hypothetical protein
VFTARKTCVMAIIDTLNSSKDCDGFPYRQLCSEKFIVDSNDAAMCEAIKQGPTQLGCYFALIRLRNNTEACMKHPEYQDCLAMRAAATGDFGLCQRVYDAASRHELAPICVSDAKLQRCLMGLDTGTDCCRALPDDKINQCYDMKLKLTNDTAWCKREAGAGRVEDDWDCYALLAKRAKDPRICESIPVDDQHDYCLEGLIAATEDRTLCGKMRDDARRRKCVRGVA